MAIMTTTDTTKEQEALEAAWNDLQNTPSYVEQEAAKFAAESTETKPESK